MFQKLSSLLKSIAGWCTTAASTVNEPGFKQTKAAKRVFLGVSVVVVLLLGDDAWLRALPSVTGTHAKETRGYIVNCHRYRKDILKGARNVHR